MSVALNRHQTNSRTNAFRHKSWLSLIKVKVVALKRHQAISWSNADLHHKDNREMSINISWILVIKYYVIFCA